MPSRSQDRSPRPVPRLEVAGLGKSYGPIRALHDVSLVVKPGEIHGVCGHNGAGKSTLVKILSGVVRSDEGSVSMDGKPADVRTPQRAQRCGVALVDQESSLIPVLSVADNLLLGRLDAPFLHRRGASAAFVAGLLARVGLADLRPATPVERLAVGQRQLVEIARTLGRDARLLILDEPTATLSDAEIEHVFAAVRAAASDGAGVIFVSHRLGEVLSLCDTVSVFRDGVRVASAPAAELDREKLIDTMVGGLADAGAERKPVVSEAATALSVRGLTVPGRLHGISFHARRGQIVALAGQVGSGTSDTLRAVAGLTVRAEGCVAVGGTRLSLGSPLRSVRSGLRYLSNDRKSEGLFLQRSVARNLIATRLEDVSRFGFVRTRDARAEARRLAASVGLEARRRDAVGTLSGGNQQKVFLGRCLQRQAPVLLLDEPTRGVDVGGRAEIHAMIRDAARDGAAVVYASTELDEILDLADVVVTLCAGRVVSARPRGEVTMTQVAAEMTHAEREPISA